jgi:hypothetical protein
MIEYSAYFQTDAGVIRGVQSIYSTSNGEALKAARNLLIEARLPTVEVWDHSRCIGAVDLE